MCVKEERILWPIAFGPPRFNLRPPRFSFLLVIHADKEWSRSATPNSHRDAEEGTSAPCGLGV